MSTIHDFILSKARYSLTDFVVRKAHKLSKELGFSYIESDKAPNSFDELRKAYNRSLDTREPLPVYSGASDNTIYMSKEGNWAFRFWHDVVHVQCGYAFTLEDEVKCSNIQCEEVKRYFGENSLEYRLIVADTIGQSLYATLHFGEFPQDQLAYVKSLLNGEF